MDQTVTPATQDIDDELVDHLLVVSFLVTIALFFSIAVCAISHVYQYTSIRFVSAVISVVLGVVMIIAVGWFSQELRKEHGPRQDPDTPP